MQRPSQSARSRLLSFVPSRSPPSRVSADGACPAPAGASAPVESMVPGPQRSPKQNGVYAWLGGGGAGGGALRTTKYYTSSCMCLSLTSSPLRLVEIIFKGKKKAAKHKAAAQEQRREAWVGGFRKPRPPQRSRSCKACAPRK